MVMRSLRYWYNREGFLEDALFVLRPLPFALPTAKGQAWPLWVAQCLGQSGTQDVKENALPPPGPRFIHAQEMADASSEAGKVHEPCHTNKQGLPKDQWSSVNRTQEPTEVLPLDKEGTSWASPVKQTAIVWNVSNAFKSMSL